MANELTVTKEQTARFVHDAVEMETAIFTLDRAIEECENKKRVIITQAEENHRCKVKKLDHYTNKYRSDSNDYANHSLMKYIKKECTYALRLALGFALISVLPVLIIVWFISTLTGASGGWVISTSIGIIALISLGISIIPFIIEFSRAYSQYIKQQKVLEKTKDSSQSYYYSAQQGVKDAERELAQAKEALQPLDMQLAVLHTQRQQLATTLARFYSIGVIPFDYRHLDCVIMLDQIFRNDLADTIREAILIYDERIFRGEIIKGMDKISSMLNKLSVSMAYIGSALHTINDNVTNMSKDLYAFSEQIADGQKAQLRATETLVHESELSRYANDQLIKSTKKLEWYAEEKRRRQGWV